MGFKTSFFLLMFFLTFGLVAQEGIEFKTTVSSNKVLENEIFNVKFTLYNARGSSFEAPKFNNLEVVRGPAQGYGSQTINNKSTSYVSIEYSVKAKKIGEILIGPASIKANGKKLKTEIIKIEVLKAKNLSENNSDEVKKFFIKTDLDSNRVYVGQQLGINYLMYSTERIQNRNVNSFPEFDEFFLIYLNDPYFDTKRDIIDGVAYNIKTIRSIALFPFQSGVFEIEAIRATAGILLPGSFLSRYTSKQLVSEPFNVTVLPLPEPKPDNFSNGVGKYKIQAKTNKNYAVLGESIVLTVLVEGDGIPKTFVMPELDMGEDFEVYGPELIKETSENLNPKFTFQKQYEFTIVPKKIGRQVISYDLSYFDVDSSAYQTLRTPRFVCNVVANSNANEISENKSTPAIFDNEIDVSTNKWHKINQRFFGSPLFWTCSFIPLIGIGFLNLWKWRTGSLNFKREKQASFNPDSRLQKLSSYASQNEGAHFFQSLESIFQDVLVEHSNDKTIALNIENFNKHFETHSNITQLDLDQFAELFNQIELARYGGYSQSNLEALYKKAEMIFTKLL